MPQRSTWSPRASSAPPADSTTLGSARFRVLFREPDTYLAIVGQQLRDLAAQIDTTSRALESQVRAPDVLPRTRARCEALLSAARQQHSDIADLLTPLLPPATPRPIQATVNVPSLLTNIHYLFRDWGWPPSGDDENARTLAAVLRVLGSGSIGTTLGTRRRRVPARIRPPPHRRCHRDDRARHRRPAGRGRRRDRARRHGPYDRGLRRHQRGRATFDLLDTSRSPAGRGWLPSDARAMASTRRSRRTRSIPWSRHGSSTRFPRIFAMPSPWRARSFDPRGGGSVSVRCGMLRTSRLPGGSVEKRSSSWWNGLVCGSRRGNRAPRHRSCRRKPAEAGSSGWSRSAPSKTATTLKGALCIPRLHGSCSVTYRFRRSTACRRSRPSDPLGRLVVDAIDGSRTLDGVTEIVAGQVGDSGFSRRHLREAVRRCLADLHPAVRK